MDQFEYLAKVRKKYRAIESSPQDYAGHDVIPKNVGTTIGVSTGTHKKKKLLSRKLVDRKTDIWKFNRKIKEDIKQRGER